MGWGSAGSIFETVADALIAADAETEVIIKALVPLIEYLKSEDWDTVDESLETYQRREGYGPVAVIKALAETGEELTYCGESRIVDAYQGSLLRYTCCKYDGHPGKHRPTTMEHGEWA